MRKPKHSEEKKTDPKAKRAAEAAGVRRDNATSKRGETTQARGESSPPDIPSLAERCANNPVMRAIRQQEDQRRVALSRLDY